MILLGKKGLKGMSLWGSLHQAAASLCSASGFARGEEVVDLGGS